MRTLDLSLQKRPTVRIILPRKRKSIFSRKQILDVTTSSKSTRELFSFLGESLIKVSENKATEDDFERLYDVTARILSRNRQGIEISKSDIEARLDTSDIIRILKLYSEFLTETIKSKN